MPELRFTDSVVVYELDNDRAQLVKASKAEHLLLRGDASIHSWTKDGKQIVALRAVYRKKRAEQLQSVRPGSFGVTKLAADGHPAGSTEYGARIYEHRDPLPMLERGERAA